MHLARNQQMYVALNIQRSTQCELVELHDFHAVQSILLSSKKLLLVKATLCGHYKTLWVYDRAHVNAWCVMNYVEHNAMWFIFRFKSVSKWLRKQMLFEHEHKSVNIYIIVFIVWVAQVYIWKKKHNLNFGFMCDIKGKCHLFL